MTCVRCKQTLDEDAVPDWPADDGRRVKPFVHILRPGTSATIDQVCLDCLLWRERHLLLFVK